MGAPIVPPLPESRRETSRPVVAPSDDNRAAMPPRGRGARYVVTHRAWLGPQATDAIRARAGRVAGARLDAYWPDADAYEVAGRTGR